MGDRLRLVWRMQRWELAFLIGGPVLFALTLLGLTVALDAILPPLQACWVDDPNLATAECRSLRDWGNILPGLTAALTQAVGFVPFAVGILLGAPLIAREIEHRTAPIAWSLSPSRVNWLIGRIMPIVVLVALALVLLGQSNEAALGAMTDAELGFRQFGQFGPLVAARGLGVFALGVVVGLVAGRVLPAILVTAGLTIGVMALITWGTSTLQRAEAEWHVVRAEDYETVQMIWDSGFRNETTGETITWEEAYERFPEELDRMMTAEDAPEGWVAVSKYLSNDRYDDYVLRESAVFLALALLAAGLAVAVVRMRRPG